MRIGIFGTGMIGASAGLAARARGDEVLGFDTDANAATQALELGAIDRIVGRDELYATCEAVILAPHLHATLDELARIASHTFRNELLIIDVASVKTPVAQAGSAQAAFVPAHPMAGRERHGPAAARADLFTDRTWCYVPTSDAARTERARALIERLGAIPVAVDAREHDRIVALTSHLPQLIAYAFTQCVGELDADPQTIDALCGPAARELLRLGRSGTAMWNDIFAANAEAVTAARSHLEAVLDDRRLSG